MPGALNFFYLLAFHSFLVMYIYWANTGTPIWNLGILFNSTSFNTTAFPYQEPLTSVFFSYLDAYFQMAYFQRTFANAVFLKQSFFWQFRMNELRDKEQHSHTEEYAGSICNNKRSLRGTHQCQQISWYFGTVLSNYMGLWQLHLNNHIF